MTYSMSDYTNFADFNVMSITGRLAHAELVKYRENTFLSLHLISNLMDGDDTGVTVKFTNSNGLITLFNKGLLQKGRFMTVTGHLKTIRSSYMKNGSLTNLKRPEITLTKAQVLNGGLGPSKKANTQFEYEGDDADLLLNQAEKLENLEKTSEKELAPF